ncbi:MAG: SOS response-associated peptidase [Pseudomonadota bacterium]
MCGRFALTLPADAVANLFDASWRASYDTPRYNLCPTQLVAVCVAHEGERLLTTMRWGFIPHWYKSPSDGPLLINARSETIAEKPAFGSAVRSRRCLIPASGFFEWFRDKSKPKEPWYITPKGQEAMAFAGIWQAWTSPENGERLVTCAIVTAEASEPIAEIHHREPVVISPEHYGLWLGEEGKGAATCLGTAKPGFFAMHRVDPKVNSARHDSADLIEALAV